MSFDYKKEYKEYYMPKNKPEIIKIPSMNFIAVRGSGNPNAIDGEYSKAMSILYTIAFTLKMSYKTDYKIDGYFSYVVPPLEGFWWMDNGMDYEHKENFKWISLIRLPDFITLKDFEWAKKTTSIKKNMDLSKAEFFTYDEGLCVQSMHIGSFDTEPSTIKLMENYALEQGYEIDITDKRYHHEIYMSDFRKVKEENRKTVIRYPIK